ncbi:hypothetical protein [Kitasatospora sp. NPDC090091]|uniref:hypothetical protein n=1 Tax=Kitasatospora sp. NPDC090091 TaxID=3364081 RepID=UPI00381C0F6E
MMPDLGETALGPLANSPPTDLRTSMVGDPAGTTTIDPKAAGRLFHAQLGEAERARHASELVPQRMAPGHQPTTIAAWHQRPSTYVVCAEDRVMHPDLKGHGPVNGLARLLGERTLVPHRSVTSGMQGGTTNHFASARLWPLSNRW